MDDENKRLAELLGLCWHEIEVNEVYFEYPGKCSCGLTFFSQDRLCEHIEVANPDFTTDAGKVQLLREMMKRDDFYGEYGFIKEISSCGDIRCVSLSLILDTSGGLRDACLEWLEKEK